MDLVEHGLVKDGQILLNESLPLPDGTEVSVHVTTVRAASQGASTTPIESLAFFGMWTDRDDMMDSSAWLERERASWHERLCRQDS